MLSPKKAIEAAVIGYPISHSLSPKIHNFLLKQHQISGIYKSLEVKEADLENFIDLAKKTNLAGFNVTIPHKEEIFKICDFKSKTASLTGAVNTVLITPDKKLFGHNSDAEGFLNNLKNSCRNFDLKNKTVFLIGAGGAARAIVYALIKSGVKTIFISNRNQLRAEELIENFADFSHKKNCEIKFLESENFAKRLNCCDLLINSTSLGMQGQEALKIDLKNLNSGAIVYDIVYKPLMTELLTSSQSRKNNIVTGIGMLVFQALIGFEMWFGQKPDEKFVQELLKTDAFS
jgi:shikimate dehydrogenase